MKQEYHYTIARSDRIWLTAFVIFLLAWELVKYALPGAAIEVIHDNSLEKTDSVIVSENPETKGNSRPDRIGSEKEYYSSNSPYEDDETITPFPIQEATFKDLRSAGLTVKVANNILKYISAGGKVKTTNDLMKIYGMDSTQLLAASPYLIYPANEKVLIADSLSKSYSPKYITKNLDLNTATALQLDSLPGIGLVLAERIIKFKEGLGGFFEVDQLKDIYGLPPETFEKIAPYLTVTTPPSLININELDLTNFTHPYLHKRFPKMIQAYKNHHGPFMNASDFRKVYPPDSTWCDKILPYITFE